MESIMSAKYMTVVIFIMVGGTAFLLDIALLHLFQTIWLPNLLLARVPGFFLVTLYTWLLNRYFTFKTSSAPTLREYFAYLMGSAVGWLCSTPAILL